MDVAIDEAYHSECCQEAINRGFPMDGKYSIHEYMDVGVAMASNAYTHLPDAARMWMCLFTAIATRIDDKVIRGEDMMDVYHFNERFVSCQPQGDPILNALDVILREIASLHSPLVSSLITVSTLNFMCANCLDFETQDMQVWFISESRIYYVLTGIVDLAQDSLVPRVFQASRRLGGWICLIYLPFHAPNHGIHSMHAGSEDCREPHKVSTSITSCQAS